MFHHQTVLLPSVSSLRLAVRKMSIYQPLRVVAVFCYAALPLRVRVSPSVCLSRAFLARGQKGQATKLTIADER